MVFLHGERYCTAKLVRLALAGFDTVKALPIRRIHSMLSVMGRPASACEASRPWSTATLKDPREPCWIWTRSSRTAVAVARESYSGLCDEGSTMVPMSCVWKTTLFELC